MANEKRLIDANLLGRDTFHIECEEDGETFERLVVDWLDIESAPTVDAVEVVRCKDCKHYGCEQEPCHGKTQRFCRLHKGLVIVDRDTFCSYGERKDND